MLGFSGNNRELKIFRADSKVNLTTQSSGMAEGCRTSNLIMSHGLTEGRFPTRGNTRRCQRGLQVDDAVVDQSA